MFREWTQLVDPISLTTSTRQQHTMTPEFLNNNHQFNHNLNHTCNNLCNLLHRYAQSRDIHDIYVASSEPQRSTSIWMGNGNLRVISNRLIDQRFDNTGRPYFIDHANKTTTYNDPRALTLSQPPPQPTQQAQVNPNAPLPPGWEMVIGEDSDL